MLRLSRELAWVASGQVVGLIASVGLTKLLTLNLGPEEYGRLALLLTVPTFLNQALFGPLISASTRFVATYREKGLLGTMLTVIDRTVRTGILVLGAIGVAGAVAVGSLIGDATLAMALLLALAFGILFNLYGLYNAMHVAARRRSGAAIHQAIDPIARLSGAALAVAFAGPTVTAALAGLAAGSAVTFASQRVVFGRGVTSTTAARPEDARAIGQDLWSYGRFFLLWGPFTWALFASDRWALKTFGDDSTVGIYAAAFQLAFLPAIIVPSVVAQFFTPIVFERVGDATDVGRRDAAVRAVQLAVATTAAVVGVATLVAFIAGEPLLVLFTSSAYRDSAPFLPYLILGLGLGQIGQVLSLVPMSFNRLRAYSVLKIGQSVAAVALNAFGAFWFGLAGVCAAQVAIGALYVVGVIWTNRRILNSAALMPRLVGS